ncbi:MAG: M23 family metallopeptidase [Spirochaetaceae bacterium]|nr:M23 family metallopeptidase [Spirochaetaceae bacterium]
MSKRLIKKYCITGTLLLIGLIGAILFVPYFDKINHSGQGGYETPVMPILSGSQAIGSISNLTQDYVVLEEDEDVSNTGLFYKAYRVKEGDMIGYIAEQFNVTQDTIISVNNIRQSRLIQIGQYLKIPSMPGILYTVREDGEQLSSIAEKYEISLEKCVAVNNIQSDISLREGTSLFLPDAELDWVTRQEINGDLFLRPLKGRYYFSSYWGWRASPFTGKRTFHGGIDMAANTGTPVYAALHGTVVAAGWDNTYGNFVRVKHHSGYTTLYAHLSKISVKKGASVGTETKLGEVGSTGLSTGPHLHFSVYKNGVSVNPQNLWN